MSKYVVGMRVKRAVPISEGASLYGPGALGTVMEVGVGSFAVMWDDAPFRRWYYDGTDDLFWLGDKEPVATEPNPYTAAITFTDGAPVYCVRDAGQNVVLEARGDELHKILKAVERARLAMADDAKRGAS